MMKKKRVFIIMIGLLLAITFLVGGCSTKDKKEEDTVDKDGNIVAPIEDEDTSDEEDALEEQGENPYDIEVGKLAPNFTLENLDGEEVSLEDYRGKIVMLNFWASWCSPCRKEMPDMNQLHEEDEDLIILAVNVKEEKDKVKKYIEEGEYDFEVVLDFEGDIAQTYLVSGFPTSYFIDEEGILLGGVSGMLEYPQMKQLLEGIRENQ